MSLLDRFLFKKKEDPINNSISKKKRFSIKQLYRKKPSKKEDENSTVPENQHLLTQCIETALGSKRWTVVDTTSLCFSDMQPTNPPRQRKLSLPPQYSNIGYLASIPEVDSFTEKQ
ncbi:hypothetical protein MFLAVUS_003864 [Mucor flavus]|uniref:Uncharacterized protein n=1 Tax=Mucor flavus TaxID=439312 RepID=A0ABP9YUA4_9FUNG